jgi:hypothetical protein
VEVSKDLPEWTNTELEWLSVNVSLVLKFVSIIVLLYLLILLKRNIKAIDGGQPDHPHE